MISLDEFLQLPTMEIAKLVKASGSKVVVFPINGTRRWFMLEHGRDIQGDLSKAYADVSRKGCIKIYKLCFAHGLDTLITPIFGGELLNRGDEYVRMVTDGFKQLATHPDFLSFYEEYNVRVRFYGDYRRQFAGTPYAHLSGIFDEISQRTAQNDCHRLFYGLFANDATETIAELSVRHFQKTGAIPSHKELIEAYYGDHIEKADIFIGFEKFNVFDYPLLGLGEESLYFTIAPSLYLTESQLCNILYDHLYLRPVQDPDYADMPAQDFESMRTYYQKNRKATFGVGEMRAGIWYAKTPIQE